MDEFWKQISEEISEKEIDEEIEEYLEIFISDLDFLISDFDKNKSQIANYLYNKLSKIEIDNKKELLKQIETIFNDPDLLERFKLYFSLDTKNIDNARLRYFFTTLDKKSEDIEIGIETVEISDETKGLLNNIKIFFSGILGKK